MEDENLLGQGGGGTVYEGKYDGIDVAIKKIVKWDTPQKFIRYHNIALKNNQPCNTLKIKVYEMNVSFNMHSNTIIFWTFFIRQLPP